jgi:hypothetical protein
VPKPVNGSVSWQQSLKEKYAQRIDKLDELQTLQAEISILELHILMQEMRLPVADHDQYGDNETPVTSAYINSTGIKP